MRGTHHPTGTLDTPSDLDLDKLLHPAHAFADPQQVVDDPDLSLNEKRAILASWASDSCAVEAAPALRRAPGGSRTVTVDDILEALRMLDRQANPEADRTAWGRRQVRRNWLQDFRVRRSRGQNQSGPGISG